MHEINPFESIYMLSELDFGCEVKEGVTSNCPTLLLYTAERHPTLPIVGEFKFSLIPHGIFISKSSKHEKFNSYNNIT